jgi:hypothetical protein
VNDASIGVAAASNWERGGSPRIISMVRTMLLVEYNSLSTKCRRVYGLITRATVLCAST